MLIDWSICWVGSTCPVCGGSSQSAGCEVTPRKAAALFVRRLFLRCLTCLSIGKTGKKCLHLGSFDNRITLLQYAQKQGVQEGKV